MPHLDEVADLIMKKLLTHVQHHHWDQIYLHFAMEDREFFAGDKWDDKIKIIV